ncbi:lipopolysaccharide biosynthesis protein [Bacteroides helcogenes]|uniref:Polysaccharide biosynthesis protein n=1 Tax=Bacteroides helcogenes (strain ATCC 35417 / DSM 20613 / JCM 6297 / CCUG 15421 / P 36-108) TaxID=693979 RepID=E6SQ83_BACT6|nr:LPS biosynthesis protein [Bacteroides helcogenes]ADV43942.1 polysaccharide biosynthesis protein [Bacteroides helcogenes P 36-108]MDY5237598.1 lipopolysaccharide biosynthesis protein [Bacteroides helcogenes]
MMQSVSYRKNYLLTYFWQLLSILLGFLSLFVVVPYLSEDKMLYGIYSVCTSLTIFFSYADLGFISAGVKYAAEYFIQGDKEKEVRMIGFVAFMMMVIFLVVSVIIIVCAVYPRLLIPELQEGSAQFFLARWLLATLAMSCPIIIGQRVLSMIFTIRVEDYKLQRLSILGSLLKIISVFYFFRAGHYQLLEYYVFFQLVNLLVVTGAFLYVRKYGYKSGKMFSVIRFDKQIFDKVKKLSGTSLIMVIAMILYYELDQIVIANFVGIEMVAIYAIALSIMSFVRTFMSLLYSPYSSRYNHYHGAGDMEGLQRFVNKIVVGLSPMVCCPIIVLSCLSAPFVESWVGDAYTKSALLVTFMVISFIPNFLGTPVSAYFMAKEENLHLIRLNVLNVLIYWAGIVVTVHWMGIYSFAIFKSVAPVMVAVGYWVIVKRDFAKTGVPFVSLVELLKALLLPVVAALALCGIAGRFMIYEHSKWALLNNLLLMGCCLVLSLAAALFTNTQMRHTVCSLVKR